MLGEDGRISTCRKGLLREVREAEDCSLAWVIQVLEWQKA
jgi:hypothetical protein